MLDIAGMTGFLHDKCRNRLTTWKDAINDLNAFIMPAQSSLQAQKKQTKVPRHGFFLAIT